MRLYDIPIEAMDIEQELSENFGELTPELEQRISEFVGQGKEKIEAACVVVKSLEDDAGICQSEAERLMKRAKGLQAAADRLKGLLLDAVDRGFSGKLKTPKFTIWGQTSSPTVHFDLKAEADLYLLSTQEPWCVRMREPELDKIALKEAVKQGKALPYCITATENPGTRYLRIK
jgi:hypothetical protein